MEVEQRELLEVLASVKPAVATRAVVPSLGAVRIMCDSVIAFDGDVGRLRYLPNEIALSPTSWRDVAVSFKVLTDALKMVGAGKIKLGSDEGDLLLETQGRKQAIRMKAAELSEMVEPPASAKTLGSLDVEDAGELANVVLRAGMFASTDQTRPILNAMPLSAGLVRATDSYRLIEAKAPLAGEGQMQPLASGMMKIVKNTKSGPLALTLGDRGMVRVDVRDGFWWVRDVVGIYPNFEKLIGDPGDFTAIVDVDVAEVLARLKAVDGIKWNQNPLKLSVNGALKMEISNQQMQLNESIENVQIGLPQGPLSWGQIGINPTFLHEAFKAITTDTARLRMVHPHRPIQIESGDDLMVVMPVRINV